MLDVEAIKARVDVRDVVERDLGRPHHRGHTYDTYRCPLHGEQKGYSLVVYADHWQCYGKCGKAGDAIAWMREYHGLDFKQAALALGADEMKDAAPKRVNATKNVWKEGTEPPPWDWQFFADQVVVRAQKYLWGKGGTGALEYLRWRGLTDEIIEMAGLGYVPAQTEEDEKFGRVLYPDWLKPDGKPVRVASGITLPHYAEGHLWGVRIRRMRGQVKYVSIAGGKAALYWSDFITEQLPVMIVEGEFDALVLHQVVGDVISPVALASTSNARLDKRWLGRLITAPVVLARMDTDGAGAKALEKLQALSPRIRAVGVPMEKDVNDYYRLCLQHPEPPARVRMLAWVARLLEDDALMQQVVDDAHGG